MATLGELLRRLSQSIEAANPQQQHHDTLRSRLGYLAEAEDEVDEPELQIQRVPERAPESYQAPPLSQPVPRPEVSSPKPSFSTRIRTRMHTPNTLREALVTKELLDRPLGLRRKSKR